MSHETKELLGNRLDNELCFPLFFHVYISVVYWFSCQERSRLLLLVCARWLPVIVVLQATLSTKRAVKEEGKKKTRPKRSPLFVLFSLDGTIVSFSFSPPDDDYTTHTHTLQREYQLCRLLHIKYNKSSSSSSFYMCACFCVCKCCDSPNFFIPLHSASFFFLLLSDFVSALVGAP
jgi:hypothetical protein